MQVDARGHQRSVAREADQHQALVGVEPEQVRDQLHDLAWAADLEAGSVRDGRVDWYLELAAHSFGDRRSDLVFITKDPVQGEPLTGELQRYATANWLEVADVIEGAWSDAAPRDAAVASVFCEYLRNDLAPRNSAQVDAPVGRRTLPSRLGARR